MSKRPETGRQKLFSKVFADECNMVNLLPFARVNRYSRLSVLPHVSICASLVANISSKWSYELLTYFVCELKQLECRQMVLSLTNVISPLIKIE